MAVRRSYTRCNQPGRLEAGTESSPGRRYHLRAMGDEGAFVFFHILVFTLILSVVCLLLELEMSSTECAGHNHDRRSSSTIHVHIRSLVY